MALGDKGSALPRRGTEIGNVTLAVFRPWVVGFAGVGLLMIAFGLAGQFWRTAMLRERTPVVNEGLPPFSLAKVQIGWWGLLVVGGFLFLFFATGEYNGIVTSSTLGLIGISGLTLIVARGIDQQTEAPADRTTNGFFHDLVTDGDSNNVALQRLQMVVWNGILGLIFVYLSLKRLTFPEFDQNLLVLAGLVSATYAGFKIPENAAKKGAAKGGAGGGGGGGGGGGQGAGQGGAGQGGDGQGAQGAGQNGDGQGARDRGAGD